MKYLDLFTGIGGFTLGIEQAYEICNANRSEKRGVETDQEGNERPGLLAEKGKDISSKEGRASERPANITDKRPLCIGFSEIDKYASAIYQKHYPNHKNYGDITKLDPDTLPDFDLLVGGFPCQSFSIAGKRRGFADTRGTLFFEIARILEAKKPRLFILENVRGLLSHDEGRTFRTIIATLDELGYDLQWQVLNSKNFGVPQNRERVYIVGHLRGTSRPEVFPITDGNPKGLEELTTGASQGYRVYGENGINPTLASEAGGVGAKTGLVCPTIRATQYKGGDNQTVIAHTVQSSGRASGIDKKQNWDSYLVEGKIRRLTPTECERLQGFPDGWTEGVSDTQRYKCLGNAVTVNVVREVMKRILK